MKDIRSILAIAAQRLWTSLFLDRLHLVAVVLGGAALLLVLIGKTTPALALPWMVAGPALLVVGLGAAFFMWIKRRPGELQIALAVDDRLDLREKLSTALHVSGRDDAFARAAVEDAIGIARDGRTREAVRRRFPVEPPNRWWISPLIITIALAAGWLLPQGDVFARSAEERPVVQPVSQDVAYALDATIEQIRSDEALSRHLEDELEALNPANFDPEALKSPQGDRREAIKRLSTLKDRLDEILQGEQAKTIDALKRAMSDMKMPTEDGPAKDLMEAMAKGDFQAASEAMKQLQEQAMQGDLDPAKAQQMAQQLQQIAQQMEQLAQQQKALEDALRQAGMDPNLAQNPQQLEQALQENQQLTEQEKQQLQQMAQAQQQACQMCQGMAQGLSQMAQAMGQLGQGGGQNGMDQQQMQQAADQMQQMLGDLEAMQQMLRSAEALGRQ